MKKKSFPFAAVFLFLCLAELVCALGLRIAQGGWIYTRAENQNYALFEPHPQLVGIPRKSISVVINNIHYAHNAQGFRGSEPAKQKAKKRIICIGGSTTYGIGVSNNETWPYYLDSLLQPEFEVLNLGIPGHTTAEHKKLLPLALEKYHPDIVILHCGLNDIRNMHVHDFGNDYSRFHQPSLSASLGFCAQDRLPRVALAHVVFYFLQAIHVAPACPFRNTPPAGTLSDSVDGRVAEIFSANLDTLVALCAAKHIPVFLLPQVLSEDAVTDENLKWWIPYLTKKGIISALDTMNRIMENKAVEKQASFIVIAKDELRTKADFYDACHLNADGNLKLAEIVKTRLNSRPAFSSQSVN